MNKIVWVLAILLWSGCASTPAHAPFKAIADPQVAFTSSSSYAFLPERDMRLEKRLLCERATSYLANSGLRMSSPEAADFLIRVHITTQFVTSVSTDVLPSSMARQSLAVSSAEGLSTFTFYVYRRSDLLRSEQQSVWEGSVVAAQKDFRAREEAFIKAVFSQLGKTIDAPLSIASKG